MQMSEQTSEFQACSSEIRRLIRMLDNGDCIAEAARQLLEQLKHLQELESKRLQYFLILHVSLP